MSGHSKWSTIKRKKEKTDAARGKVFTRFIREITVAAREGGGDIEGNPRLRTAVATARASSMPSDNIKKAIQRGTGELPGVSYDEIQYEAYGPGGVAILVQVLTDNKNRTVSEIRHLLSRFGGNMGEAGCVNWMFHKQGMIQIDAAKAAEDVVYEAALDAGAVDVATEAGAHIVVTSLEDFDKVKSALEAKKIPIASAELSMVPQSNVRLEGKEAQTMMRLMEMLEEHDDVQHVYANFDIDEAVMEKYGVG